MIEIKRLVCGEICGALAMSASVSKSSLPPRATSSHSATPPPKGAPPRHLECTHEDIEADADLTEADAGVCGFPPSRLRAGRPNSSTSWGVCTSIMEKPAAAQSCTSWQRQTLERLPGRCRTWFRR